MTSLIRVAVAALAFFAAAWAQDRDFLTPDEADQVRVVQEPNQRLTLYIKFAKLRMELLRQSMASTKPGRSIFIHDTIEDLTRIIEAIDTVSDDALRRKVNIDKGLALVVEGEKPILEQLNKIIESQPRDYSRYKFTIEQAVETLQDSIELAGQDLGSRTAALSDRDKRDKKARDEMGTETDAKKATEVAKEKENAPPAKKAPTLRRKGEVPDKDKDKPE